MIVHIETGKSFKGAGLYLLHDKRGPGEAERLTSDRVAWTYSLNTLENDPQHVIREMQATCFNQPMLKLMSGNRVDGSPTQKPVMTVALSWSPDQPQPTQAGIIAACKSYLKEMGWSELQALIVAHRDTDHCHAHILINRVNPQTGMTQDDAWRKNRAVQWARAYDAEQGFFLARREAKYARGEAIGKDMTRAEWEAWQAAGGTQRGAEGPEAGLQAGEWEALKAAQRDERKAFFKASANLRADLRDHVRQAVKEAFADQWSDYAAHRDGLAMQQKARDLQTRRAISHLRRHGQGASSDGVKRLQETQARQYAEMKAALAAMRAPIIKAQQARTLAVAETALAQLAKGRAAAYEALKASHRDDKKELRADQAAGTPRPDLLHRQQAAAAQLAAVAQPRPVPVQEAPVLLLPTTTPAQPVQRYTGQPRPAFGVSRNEAVRRYHDHGGSPSPPPTAQPSPVPATADRVPVAAKETAQVVPPLDVSALLTRRAAARADVREDPPAPGTGTGLATHKQSERMRRIPRSNPQAFIDVSNARAAERSDDRGRELDR